MFFIEDVKKGAGPYIEMVEPILEFYQKEFNLFESWDIGFTVRIQNRINHEVHIEIVSQPLPIGTLGVWRYVAKEVVLVIEGSVWGRQLEREESSFRARFWTEYREERHDVMNLAPVGEADINLLYNFKTKEVTPYRYSIASSLLDSVRRHLPQEVYESCLPTVKKIDGYRKTEKWTYDALKEIVSLLESLGKQVELELPEGKVEDIWVGETESVKKEIQCAMHDYNSLLEPLNNHNVK